MTTLFLVLKISALLVVMLLPLGGPGKRKKGNFIELSNWAINENGCLVSLTKTEPDHLSL
jgi:hypothetical protein